jgi:hypothetical protein
LSPILIYSADDIAGLRACGMITRHADLNRNKFTVTCYVIVAGFDSPTLAGVTVVTESDVSL